MSLGHLWTGGREFLNGDEVLALAALHDVPGGGLAEAGNRDERREEPAVPDEEFCGMRGVKVNIVEREAAQIEFIRTASWQLHRYLRKEYSLMISLI